MIPKIIHYCWFGRGEKPESVKRYINSWHTFLPEYEFKEWNEDNFDLDINQYVREAYNHRKFAFVTDFVRLYALFMEGGIYMDTDVEVIKPFDPFLHHHAFSGFETDGNVPTGMMAAEKGSLWAKELLEGYRSRHFILKDGSLDFTTNTSVITKYMVEKGLKLDNTFQEFPNLCTMYPASYFCPKDHRTGKIRLSPETVCIHHFAGSWLEQSLTSKLRHRLKLKMTNLIGERITVFLSDLITLRYFKR